MLKLHKNETSSGPSSLVYSCINYFELLSINDLGFKGLNILKYFP